MPQFTSGEWIAIITIIGVVAVNIINSIKGGRKTDKVIDIMVGNENSPGLVGKLDQIHELTNSGAAAAASKIENQTVEIKALQDMIRELKEERGKKELLAATAIVPPEPNK